MVCDNARTAALIQKRLGEEKWLAVGWEQEVVGERFDTCFIAFDFNRLPLHLRSKYYQKLDDIRARCKYFFYL